MKLNQTLNRHRPWLALSVPLLACAVQWLGWTWIKPYIWFLFYPSLFLSSWIGGKRIGMAATLLSAGLAVYFFEPPQLSWVGKAPRVWLSVLAFGAMGALFSYFHELLRQANREASDALAKSQALNDHLEARVRDRTAAIERTSATLQLSEERLAGIVTSAMDAIISVDYQQRVVLFNRSAERIFGCPANEALNQQLSRFIPERFRTQHEKHLENFGRTGVTSRSMKSFGTLYATRIDGTEFPIEASISQVEVGGQKLYTVIVRDITERLRAQQALAENQATLRAVIDGSREPIFLKDLESRILLANPAALAVMGKTEQEVIGRHDGEIYADAITAEKILAADRRIMASGIGESLEETVRTAEGERTFLSNKTPHRDGNGNVIGLIGVSVDITERKRIDRELREREARFRTTLDCMLEACQIIGHDWRYLYLNDTAARYGRTTPDALLGKTVLECYPNIHGTPMYEALRAGLEDREGSRRDYQFIYEDGTTAWFDLRIQPVPEGIFIISLDVTERRRSDSALRESEERFRQLAENINEVFWIIEPGKTEVVYVSPAFQTIWGYPCENLYADAYLWISSIHPEDRPQVEQARRTKLESGTFSETYRVVRPDGTVRWVHDRAFPLRDATGRVYRVVGTAEDITEHQKLETQLRHSQKMEAIGTLAGGIAHDFNNILAAILGFGELIQMNDSSPGESSDYAGEILKAAQRATALVRQILTFSRQEQQERRAVQLRHLVTESLALLRATIPTTIEFATNLAPDAAPVLAEPSQIHQIVMNLGTNAWHAMRGRVGKLTIALTNIEVDQALATVTPQLRPGPYVRLSVSDTGSGMDRTTMERIFEPFFTTKGPGEGTGLGLSVVHGIMQSHDGAITVYSRRGEGTVFHLYFPAILDGAIEVRESVLALPQGHGEHILFVDDEEPILRIGKSMLTSLAYRVTGFTVVTDALEALRRDPATFNLIITDQNMPHLTGVEFARQAKAIRQDIPIILTTGFTAELTVEKLRALGIADLLLKPVRSMTLATCVRALLDQENATSN